MAQFTEAKNADSSPKEEGEHTMKPTATATVVKTKENVQDDEKPAPELDAASEDQEESAG